MCVFFLTRLTAGCLRGDCRVILTWCFFSSQLSTCFSLVVRSCAAMLDEKVSSFTCTGAVETTQSVTARSVEYWSYCDGSAGLQRNYSLHRLMGPRFKNHFDWIPNYLVISSCSFRSEVVSERLICTLDRTTEGRYTSEASVVKVLLNVYYLRLTPIQIWFVG